MKPNDLYIYISSLLADGDNHLCVHQQGKGGKLNKFINGLFYLMELYLISGEKQVLDASE